MGLWRGGGLLLVAVSLTCSSSPPTAAPTEAVFVVPGALDELSDVHFFDHPWPSDLRRDPGGAIHFTGFYNPRLTPILDDYVKSTVGLLDGFSPAAAIYLRFTGDLDPSTLPATPPDGLAADAAVQLVDVDPLSPERGHRKLTQLFFQAKDGVYWVSHTLAVMPALGYPLRPKTRYALVVTKKARDTSGNAVQPSSDLKEVLGTAPSARTLATHDLFAPALTELSLAGIAAGDIVHLTVFTTSDPTSELFAVRDALAALVPAPVVRAGSWQAMEQTPDYDVYQGWYGPSPNFQAGKVPFQNLGDGGSFVFDASGKPVVQGMFDMRFTLVVPNATKCPPPPPGYPLVLYAHGTGGDYRSIVTEGNSIGEDLAGVCLASMGVDQIFHGARPGAPPASDPSYLGDVELLFFNLNNPIAARTNARQGAIDVVQQARLVTDTHVAIPASVSRTGVAIGVDASTLQFFGHSQGGLNGPLFLAADDKARGGVLSGSGSMLTITLLEKTLPVPSVASAVKALLGLTTPDAAAELNPFHPVMNLTQTLLDATDPIHYVGSIFQHPRSGFAPKSIYQTEGIGPDGTGDSFAPPHGIELESVALGLPRELPGERPVTEASWGGIADVSVPPAGLSGNLGGGRASGVLAQFPPAPGSDGHFVVFDVPAAHAQAASFCRNLADDPRGRVPALP